ncbi:MAG: DegT/DnrJ/EryC1/StrS family aminotransferase [Terracidiphilus sp.]
MMNATSEAPSGSGANVFHFLRGRVALCAILRALKMQPGDEVLLQAFTCLAVPSPIVGMGLKPVFVDVDPGTCNMNPESLQARITARSRVILVQHTFGIPAPLNAILSQARRHGLVVIEDCCHVLGSRYEGRDLGTLGDAAFYSYEWGKPVVIGVGGTAVIHSESILKAVQSSYRDYRPPKARDTAVVNLQYVAHALLRRPAFFWTVREAYRFLSKSGLIVSSFREEEFEGKLNSDYETRMADGLRRRLSVKSSPARVTRSVEHRFQLGRQYETFMRESGLRTAIPPTGSETVFLRFPLYVRDKAKVLEMARDARIEMGDWFLSPVHPLSPDQWPVVNYAKGSCPVAERLSNTLVTLPVTETVGPRDMEKTLAFLAKMADAELLETRPARSMQESAEFQPAPGVFQ